MIPKECKRLAEVDFPIAAVSRHAVREKSIRHGHPSTLHLWWARPPLAACPAMLLALLLPDATDPHCPEEFKLEARKILAPVPVALEPDDEGLRRAFLKFIGNFAVGFGDALYIYRFEIMILLRVKAKSLLCYWAVRDLGIGMAQIARRLNLSLAEVSQSVKRGETIVQQKGYNLIDP